MKMPTLGLRRGPATAKQGKGRAPRANGRFDVREKSGTLSIVVLVWLGLNLAIALLVNAPRAKEVTLKDEQALRVASQIANKTDDVERLRDEYARITSGNTGLDNFYDVVLSTKQLRLVSFQRELREIAKQFNINFESVNYNRENFAKEKVAKFDAMTPLSGSYANLREFVERIERSENFIVIEQIQLANSKEGGIILSLGINLATYFVDPEIPEPVVPGQAAKPPRRS